MSRTPLMVGTVVSVNLSLEGVSAQGMLVVQAEKKLPSGKTRYGLFAADKKAPIRRSLETLTGLMQRHQLRRLSGAA